MNEDELLRKGIEAHKKGDDLLARHYFALLLKRNPRSESGWIWLSATYLSTEERRACLANALSINPNNEAVRRGLAELGPGPVRLPDIDRLAAESFPGYSSGGVVYTSEGPQKVATPAAASPVKRYRPSGPYLYGLGERFLTSAGFGAVIFPTSLIGGAIVGFVLAFLIVYGYIGIPWGRSIGDGGLMEISIVLIFMSPFLIPISAFFGIVGGIIGLLLGLLLGIEEFALLLITSWIRGKVRMFLIIAVLTASGAIGINWVWREFFRNKPEFGPWFTIAGGIMGLIIGLMSSLAALEDEL